MVTQQRGEGGNTQCMLLGLEALSTLHASTVTGRTIEGKVNSSIWRHRLQGSYQYCSREEMCWDSFEGHRW